jgi:hypothetical protein
VTKRTEILIEFEELIMVNHGGGAIQSLCTDCHSDTWFVSPAQASLLTKVTVRTINRWVESGAVHFVETANGLLLVCVESVNANAKHIVAGTTQVAERQTGD